MYLLKDKKAVLRFSFLILGLIITASIIFVAGGVLAGTHDAIITINPDIANCDELGATFTLNVENDNGVTDADDIFEVRIYEGGSLDDFDCGPAPSGWTLSDYAGGSTLPDYGYCEYKTQQFGSDVIIPGESLDFTFNAVMIADECSSEFKISTLDNDPDVGDHKFYFPEVDIDCVNPILDKIVGTPKITGEGFDWWITQSTLIDVDGSDDPEDDSCNLGLDYCEIIYTVDQGGEIVEVHEDFGPEIYEWDYEFDFDEDSVHDIVIKCVDIAGNEVTIEETDKVDDTPPTTLKEFIGPKKIVDGVEWIDGTTTIELTAEDGGDVCAIGVEDTFYKNVLTSDVIHYCEPDDPCLDLDLCNEIATWDLANSAPGEWLPYVEPFQKTEESCHVLFYYSVDELGNIEDVKTNCFFVDKTEPVVDKDNGNAISGTGEDGFKTDENPNGDFHWLTTEMPVTFTCTDQGPHPSEGEELCFKVSYDYPQWDYITENYCDTPLEDGYCCVPVDDNNQVIFNFQEESMHNLEYFCKDAVEKKTETHIQYYKVDDTPPETFKYYDPAAYIDPASGLEYIDTGHLVVLESLEDGGDVCAIGVDELRYRVSGSLADSFCQNCDNWMTSLRPDMGPWNTYESPFGIDAESCHVIEYGSIDLLGNEEIKWQCVYVDKKAPEIQKNFIGPYKSKQIKGYLVEWIDGVTEIELVVTDPEPHPSGVALVEYRVTGVGDQHCWTEHSGCSTADGVGEWTEYTETIKGIEESCHLIEVRAEDNVGKESYHRQCFFVDKTPPVTTKEYIGPYYEKDGAEYIDSETLVNITAYDPEPHPSGIDVTQYRVSGSLADRFCEPANCANWMTTLRPDMGDWNTYQSPFGIAEESCHVIEYRSIDNVNKTEEINWQCVYVDKQAPIIEKEYIGPYYNDSGIEYIDSETLVNITAYDPEPHPSGLAVLEYKVSLVDDTACESKITCESTQMEGSWIPYTTPFGDIDESCHMIEIHAEDNVGKESDHKQCVFVDKTSPETVKRYSGPQYSNGLSEYSPFSTSIEVDDSGEYLEVTVTDEGDWMVWTFDFPVEEFTGDGNLNVGLIIATDGEGQGPSFQIHNNDGADSSYDWGAWLMSPWGPTIGDGWFGWHSGSNNTLVTDLDWVEATGNRNVPHNDGVMVIRIKKSELGESFHWAASPTVGTGFFAPAYDVTMQIPTAFGWTTPLVNMGVPNYIYAESIDSGYPKWINFDTLIHLIPTDAGPHKTGINATYWRNSLVSDENCWDQDVCQRAEGSGEWNLYTEPFNKREESCHLIEYYSVDNVEKTEEVNKQCVFVDNSPPTPLKVVGEPKTEWDGTDSDFYPNETAHCWDQTGDQIDCWKVTLDTPISMTCTDPDPHPVDNEKICFNVELDGDDWTGDYCNYYGGEMQDDGFCCLDHTIENFKFLESCEHNLKFYCVDALGNTNEEVDEEKFKVEGNDFEIQINKKWNLISVPVVLLNPDIKEIIPDSMGDIIKSVWAYDAELDEWYVYTPDGNAANDDLHELIPGWGYWVLALDETKILIGGSLFSEAKTPPSRNLVKGWNLIGYYGLNNQSGYYGPAGNGDDVVCALGSLCGPLWFEEWSSVVTYWQPNSNPWVNLGRYTNMDPGAGYWVFMRDSGEYSKATGCCSFFGP